MNMKQLIVLLAMLVSLTGYAQENARQDTTLLLNGRKIVIKERDGKVKVKLFEESSRGDTIENDQIFEGVYMDGQSTERRISLAVPFTKKRSNYRFEPHNAGIYMGYTQLYDGFANYNTPNSVDLNALKSWEIGFTLFEVDATLSRNKQWGISGGLGWGYTSFRLDNNTAFREIDGVTNNYPAPDGVYYNQSRLRYFYFRVPVALEWQKRINGRGPIFLSAGLEAEIRHGIHSKVKYDSHKETIDKGLNVRPVGLNLLVQGGYNDIGVYMRYATYGLFEKNKGPELYPFSFGVCWYW